MNGEVTNHQPAITPEMNASEAPGIFIVPERECKAGLLKAGNPFTALCKLQNRFQKEVKINTHLLKSSGPKDEGKGVRRIDVVTDFL